MSEDSIIKVVLAIFGAIGSVFWFIVHGQKTNISEAHKRIDDVSDKLTDQAKHNAETYARRDDVVQMKLEVLEEIRDLKRYIREGKDG